MNISFKETFVQFPSVSVVSKAGILSQDMIIILDEPNVFLCLKPKKTVLMNKRKTCAVITKYRKFNLKNRCCNIKKWKHSANIYSGDWQKITTFITMTEHITVKHCDSFWWRSMAEMTEFYCTRLWNHRQYLQYLDNFSDRFGLFMGFDENRKNKQIMLLKSLMRSQQWCILIIIIFWH